MNHSDCIKELAQALAQAQAEMPAAELNATGHYQNKYADLGSIVETARAPLAKFGLSVSQFPVVDGDRLGVETIIMHSSGEWISNQVLLTVGDEKGKSLAQVAGSIITYLRRYSLAAALGIYADEDDDGTEHKPVERKPSKPEPAPRAPVDVGVTGPGVGRDAEGHATQTVKANGNGNGDKPTMKRPAIKTSLWESNIVSEAQDHGWALDDKTKKVNPFRLLNAIMDGGFTESEINDRNWTMARDAMHAHYTKKAEAA